MASPAGRAGGRPWAAEALEEERDFCLRSLRDLDAERAAGDLDDADYQALRDSYVARAAAALRQLHGGDARVEAEATAQAAPPARPLHGSGRPVPSVPSPDGSGRPGPPAPPAVDRAATPDGAHVGELTSASPSPAGADRAAIPDGAHVGDLTSASPSPPAADRAATPDGVQVGDPTFTSPPPPSEPSPARVPGRPRRTRVLVALGVVVAASAAAWGVVASSATRLPGQEITGQGGGSVAIAQSLQAAQQAVDRGDALTAVKDYQKVLSRDPNQPQALTGEGWLLVQTQQPALLQQGLQMLTTAARAAPTYPPAHLYRGIALLSEGDYSGAIPELQWYLGHDPDAQLAPRVRAALQQAQTKAAAARG